MPTGLGGREALQKDNETLKAANAEWRTEARQGKLQNDTTIDRLWDRLQEAEDKLKQSQEQSSSHLPSHREMGGHRPCLPAAEGRNLSLLRLGKRRDLLICRPLPVNLPIWEPPAPRRHLNSRPNAQPARRRKDLLIRRKPWSQTLRPGRGAGDSKSPKRVRG